MPLFSKSPPVTNTTTSTNDLPPQRKSSLFSSSRRRSPSPVGRHSTSTSTPGHSSLFSSRRRSPSPPLTTTSSGGGVRGLLHRNGEDASIVAARERVLNAEKREKEADIALGVARTAVREARESVKRLEAEAKEEARLAKIKQSQAKSISKRGHGLGRHDHV